MIHKHTRRWTLAALLAATAAPALAEAPDRSPRPPRRPAAKARATPPAAASDLAALVAAAKLGGTVGLCVADVASGRMLESLDPNTALPPASCAKAITSIYALDRLGTGHRWVTRVLATGPVAGGIVQGDLILQGTGDPTLSTDGLGDLAARLAARGVRGVTGRFLVHAAGVPEIARIDAGQPEYAGYNPAIAGLNLNYNRVHFEWRRAGAAWNLTMDARGERFVPAVARTTMQVANRESPLFTYRQGKAGENWTVASAALGKGGARWLPVRQPAAYAGEVFQTLARAQGVRLPEPQVVARAPAATALAELASPPMTAVLADMLKYSTNLTAEVVGLTASGAATLPASGARMTDFLRGSLGAGGRFIDHSGLGGGSRISASDMVTALRKGRASGLPALMKDWGLRGEEGKALNLPGVRVPAKTGTLNFASGLVGYIEPPGGRPLAFAIFCADVARRDALAPSEREQPTGGAAWTKRARGLQARLVARWAGMVA